MSLWIIGENIWNGENYYEKVKAFVYHPLALFKDQGNTNCDMIKNLTDVLWKQNKIVNQHVHYSPIVTLALVQKMVTHGLTIALFAIKLRIIPKIINLCLK